MKRKMPASGISKYFQNVGNNIERAIINTLIYVGELCVNQARSLNTYQDQTGNLRNSIGYVIVKDGKVVHTNFERTAVPRVTKKAEQGDGLVTGLDLAEKLAGGYPYGYALIVVAGMAYALEVESRGLDVLSSAEILAERIVPRMLKQLKESIEKLGKNGGPTLGQ